MTDHQRRVAVVGAGMIGQGWAITFAQAGYRIALWDPDQAAVPRAMDQVRRKLEELATAQLLSEAPGILMNRICDHATLAEAVSDADHVQENGPEDLATRRALFAELDALAPAQAILASSTSGMRPSSFTEALPGRGRCLVAHPANPPYLLPLVELCPSPWTTAEAMLRTRQLMLDAGRRPAALHKEVDGFILNRLQGALLAEAFRMIGDGLTEPEDVDTVVRHALGPRWSFMGPLETIDLNAPGGIRDFCARYGALYEALQHQMPPRRWDAALVERIAAARRDDLPLEDIAARQAWRDRRLAALARHQAGQTET
ncbi:3-hydroxyacyl-CoA dehydrogenase [Teichococcus vastitatis]|uniref:3-hydroxyacyl-CoA dehydrogenase n=1 Tax=Teichococcus vastitatis TaxID=2307076 RepID=A0ABS9W195_9PROT|nr:3-hydroxyacyl-CoA dehydrogenase [Pseudoroseomonas vastitatis]MCI0753067.1 3-hydroxyacyl-CoA dehydrogenase [Pseudoroseomonas vastitatis]